MSSRFSPIAIKTLADVVSGGANNDPGPPIGIYRSGSEIERFMLDCNLDFHIRLGSRVAALTNYLRYVAEGDTGLDDICRVIANVIDPRYYVRSPEKLNDVVEHLNKFLLSDGWEIFVNDERPELRVRGASGSVITSFSHKAAVLNFDTVHRDIKRTLESADKDPEDAVTAACSILESVCRSILCELRLPLPAKKDIDGLIKAVQQPLDLSPGRKDLNPLIENDVRQILGGLTTAVLGIGALRTHGGDAHGRERGYGRIDARIARFAINSSSTLALFLIETWERKFRRQLPAAKLIE